MKYLVVARHADIYQEMSNWVREAIIGLAGRLKAHVGDGTVRVVTSQEARAYLTGKVLAEALGGEITSRGSLNPPAWSFVEDAQRLGEGFDTLIIVAHDDTCRSLPMTFGRQVLGTFIPEGNLRYLEMLIINCESKESSNLS